MYIHVFLKGWSKAPKKPFEINVDSFAVASVLQERKSHRHT